MLNIARVIAIPTGMGAWVKSVENAIKELQTLVSQASNVATQRSATYQVASPLRLTWNNDTRATIIAEDVSFHVDVPWMASSFIRADDGGDVTLTSEAQLYGTGVDVTMDADDTVNIAAGTSITFDTPSVLLMPDTIPTTAAAANIYRDPTTGALMQSSSSVRYKTNIAPAPIEESLRFLDNLEEVRFQLKIEADRPNAPWYVGYLAEQVDAIGGTASSYVDYTDIDGKRVPEGVRYATLVVPLAIGYKALVRQMQEHSAIIVDLTGRIEKLEELVAQLLREKGI